MQRNFLMAIHPIDLQTLYSQMAKVGRQQGAEQQLLATVKNAQQDQNKLDAQKKLSSVQQIEPENGENVKINKDGSSSNHQQHTLQKEKKEIKSEEEDSIENYIKDPFLGQRIDISG